jgi:hypothetical protein
MDHNDNSIPFEYVNQNNPLDIEPSNPMETKQQEPLNPTDNSIDIPKILQIFSNLQWYFDGDQPRHLTTQEAMDLINMLENEDVGQWPNDFCLASLYKIATLETYMNMPVSSLVSMVKDSIHRFSERCRSLLYFSLNKPEIYDRIRPIFEPVFGDVHQSSQPAQTTHDVTNHALFHGSRPNEGHASQEEQHARHAGYDEHTSAGVQYDRHAELKQLLLQQAEKINQITQSMIQMQECLVTMTRALENLVPCVIASQPNRTIEPSQTSQPNQTNDTFTPLIFEHKRSDDILTPTSDYFR